MSTTTTTKEEKPKLQVVNLARNTRGNITYLHASGKSLYIGTSFGRIRHLVVKSEKGDLGDIDFKYDEISQYPTENVNEPQIDFIDTDPETGLLFYLAGNKVFMHNAQTLKRIGDNNGLYKEKIRLFALDKKEKNHRIALATFSNYIIVFKYANEKQEVLQTLRQEISENDRVTAAAQVVCLNLMDNYVTYSVKGQAGTSSYVLWKLKDKKTAKSETIPTKWSDLESRQVKPQILALDSVTGHILLKYGKKVEPAKADGSLYFDPKNEYANAMYSDLEFSNEPIQIALSKPFVCSIVPVSSSIKNIEIQNLYKERNVADEQQRTSVKNFVLEKLPVKYITASHDLFFFSTDTNNVQVIVLPSIEELEQSLINDLFTKKAKHLVMNSGRKSKMATINEQAGFAHLFSGEIKDGFDNFNQAIKQARMDSKPPMDIRKILAHFITPTLDEFGRVNYEVQKVSKFNTPLVNPELLGPYKKDVFILSQIKNYYETKIKGQDLLKKVSTIDASYSITPQKIAEFLTCKAENFLIEFLETHRNPDCEADRVAEQVAIDYALLKLYLQRMHTDATALEKIEKMVRNKNSCSTTNDSDLFKSLLHSKKCYRFSALLHLSKGRVTQALNLLKKIGKDYEDDDKTVDGIKETVEILSKSDVFEEITKYSEWVLDKKPEEGIKIFTAKRATPLNPDKVLKFLEPYPKDIQQHYLHYLIKEEKNLEESHHTKYAELLIDNLAVIKSKTETVNSPLLTFNAGEEPGLVGKYRRDLIEHLKLNKFDYETVKAKLKDTNLYIEKAILYTNKEEYYEALSVILCELKDRKLGERYCDSLFKKGEKEDKDTPTASNSFNPFLIVYLKVCFSNKDKLGDESIYRKWAFELLNTRSESIDPAEALRVIPEDVEVKNVQMFLKKAIKSSQHRYKKSTVLKSISETSNFETRKNHKIITSRKVNINLQTPCCVCESFGKQSNNIGESVFAVFPDLSVCHMNCLKAEKQTDQKIKNIHPVTGVNFSKYPIPINQASEE